MTKEISKNQMLPNIFNTAIDRMLSALSSFYIWKWLEQARNVNNKDVEKNLAIINKYKYVFPQILISAYKSFVVDLSIFFDSEKYEDTFALGKLLNGLRDKLTDKELENLKNEIGSIKKKHKVKIDFLRKLRNYDVAHQEIKPQSRKIIYSEIEDLFSAIQEILNLISKHYNQSFYFWDHVERDVTWHMEWIFGNLERGEKARLNEIDVEFNSKLS